MDGKLDGEVVKAGGKSALVLESLGKTADRTAEKRSRRRPVQCSNGRQHLLHAVAVKLGCRLELELVVVKAKRLAGEGIAGPAKSQYVSNHDPSARFVADNPASHLSVEA